MGIKNATKFITGKNQDLNETLGFWQRVGDKRGMDGGSEFKKAWDSVKKPVAEKKALGEANKVLEGDNTSIRNLQSEYVKEQMQATGRDAAQIANDADYKALANTLTNNKAKMEQNAKDHLQTSYWGAAKGATKHAWKGMNTGTNGQVAAKWGAVAAGAVVLNGTGRALTGGGATYNSSGQRDIMGIPFV